MAIGRVLSVMITGTGRKSWVQISSCIIWMFRIPNYIAVWKNETETSLKARLKFPKRKWIDTSLFSNRRPETSLYKKLHLICKRSCVEIAIDCTFFKNRSELLVDAIDGIRRVLTPIADKNRA